MASCIHIVLFSFDLLWASSQCHWKFNFQLSVLFRVYKVGRGNIGPNLWKTSEFISTSDVAVLFPIGNSENNFELNNFFKPELRKRWRTIRSIGCLVSTRWGTFTLSSLQWTSYAKCSPATSYPSRFGDMHFPLTPYVWCTF